MSTSVGVDVINSVFKVRNNFDGTLKRTVLCFEGFRERRSKCQVLLEVWSGINCDTFTFEQVADVIECLGFDV